MEMQAIGEDYEPLTLTSGKYNPERGDERSGLGPGQQCR